MLMLADVFRVAEWGDEVIEAAVEFCITDLDGNLYNFAPKNLVRSTQWTGLLMKNKYSLRLKAIFLLVVGDDIAILNCYK